MSVMLWLLSVIIELILGESLARVRYRGIADYSAPARKSSTVRHRSAQLPEFQPLNIYSLGLVLKP